MANQQTLPAIEDEQDMVLDTLDRLIESFRGTTEGDRMVGEYFTARNIHQTGSRKKPAAPATPKP